MIRPPASRLEGVEVRPLQVHVDPRGRLAELLRPEHVGAAPFGQVYCFTLEPGAVRGNHYHDRKTEWFACVWGEAELLLEDVDGGAQGLIGFGDSAPAVVRVPRRVGHALRNVTDSPALVVAYVDESFDPGDPDTVRMELSWP